MSYEVTVVGDYPKFWTANNSFRLPKSMKRPRAAETIKWYPLDDTIKEAFEGIRIDLDHEGKETPLHEIVDNIHYTEIPGKEHITIEFTDKSSIGYYINDKDEGEREIPVKGHISSFAHKIFKTNDYCINKLCIDKNRIIEILSNITTSKRFKKYIGHYYETSNKRIKSLEGGKRKSKKYNKPKKQRTRTKPKNKSRIRRSPEKK